MALSFKHVAVVLSLLFAHAITVFGESSECSEVHRKGGAPAVFQSTKCPHWKLSSNDSLPRSSPAGTRCQVSTLQGRRRYQEDRTFCTLDVRIPFPGETGMRNVTVGMAAVFDGHNGAEASEMASKLLFEYFMLHTHFLMDSNASPVIKKFPGLLGNNGASDAVFQVDNCREESSWQELDQERVMSVLNFDNSYYLGVLKEALMRAIQDIDAEFSKEAFRRNLAAGSTATVILMADGKILVANVGDSKALLCSEKLPPPADARAPSPRLHGEKNKKGNSFRHLLVQELTRDHKPNRDDERSRVEAAGGFVLTLNGVPRVNGQLAVSRAIGDLSFKSSGVIATPEVTDWQLLGINDTYLVAASDGVFEVLTSQNVCDILSENSRSESSSSCLNSLADCIVKAAFKKGSWDNLSTIVVPLQSTLSHNIQEESYTATAHTNSTAVGLQDRYEL